MKNGRMKTTESETKYPTVINDIGNNKYYMRGHFLGMGSFGKCFVAKETESGKLFATKILDKRILDHPVYSHFLMNELLIHELLRHKHIVSFYNAFENNKFIFILLQLCSNGTLMDLQKRRMCITLIEAKYYIHQIINGVNYLHKRRIVHGDLKLSNIFLNRMSVKIGDFGLAKLLSSEGEKIKIQCGTPNYMAPEIVEKKGHSFAGDIWAIGCILYGLLTGKLPFQSYENQLTFDKISNCDFSVYVPGLRKQVSIFIRKILQKDPQNRPLITELKNDEFMQGFIPATLPEYTMWEPPTPKDLIQGRYYTPSRITSNSRYKCTGRRKRMKPTIPRLRYITNKAMVVT